ncbi:MAG TPA: aminotransferase, partial [Salinimicrobium sp.]|nr:aminotransferase [Salinimicrobium sp.]
GHQDTLAFGSLLYAIRLIEKTGMDNIGAAIKNLSEKAKAAFSEENLLENSVVNRKNHSSIFNIKGDEKLFKRLQENEIVVSQRGNGIRISFHAFNTINELEFLMEVLKKK